MAAGVLPIRDGGLGLRSHFAGFIRLFGLSPIDSRAPTSHSRDLRSDAESVHDRSSECTVGHLANHNVYSTGQTERLGPPLNLKG